MHYLYVSQSPLSQLINTGEYKCEAENPLGSTSVTHRLLVLLPPHPPTPRWPLCFLVLSPGHFVCFFSLLLCHFPISISLSPGEFTGFANIASMQRLANVTTHSVLVVWRSPRSQERWEIFLWNAQYFVKRICWPMSPPLADLSLAFFWQWRVIRVHSGKKGETRWIFTDFSGLELQKTLWIKTFYRPQFGFQVCWKALIFFVSTYRCPPSIYVKCQLPMLPPDCPPPPPDTSCPGCPAAPPSPSPSPLSTIRSFIHQPILERSKLTLVPGPLLDIQAFARKI